MKFYGGKKNGRGDSGRTEQYSRRPSGSPEEYTKRAEKRAGHRWGRGILITLGVLVLILGGAYIGFRIWAAPPKVNAGGPTVHTAQPEGTAAPQETETPIEGEAPSVAAANRRDGTYTFAIVGTDVASGSTDTILVGMLDTQAHKLNFVSIPRDTLVNTGYNRKKINYIYPACINNGKDGMAHLLETLEDVLGYQVDSYALVDVETCAKVVDAIGGVWFDVPFDMHYDGWNQDPPIVIDLKAGYQLLDGDNFVKVARYRYSSDASGNIDGGYKGGDIDRIQVQHDLLTALVKQVLSVGSIPNWGKLLDIFQQDVNTNVTAKNLGFYAQEFLKLSADDITFSTMPENYYGNLYDVGYCFPYIDDWVAMINDKLNPFDVEISRANLDMLYVSDGTVYGTQGYIRGGIQSFENYTP